MATGGDAFRERLARLPQAALEHLSKLDRVLRTKTLIYAESLIILRTSRWYWRQLAWLMLGIMRRSGWEELFLLAPSIGLHPPWLPKDSWDIFQPYSSLSC